jgi:hypothetical protein
MQPMNFPGSRGATWRTRTDNESTEPLVGCLAIAKLGVVFQAHSDGILYTSPMRRSRDVPASGADEVCEVMMDRDNITRTGARTPGVGRQQPLARGCL